MDYINRAIEKIEAENWEEAYELLEYATLLEPKNKTPYLLKTVILYRKYWEQKNLYEKYSGKKISEFFD